MARNTYIKDDWDDNALTGRSSPETGAFDHPKDTLHAGEILVGMYRPEWTTANGSPSASSGALQLPNGSTTAQQVETETRFTIGAWSWDVSVNSSTSSGRFRGFIVGDPGASDWLHPELHNNGDHDYAKINGGTTTILINSTWPNDTATHTQKVTRDPYGNHELLLNGTSDGTATDSFLPDPQVFRFNNFLDSSVTVDNLEAK